MTYMKQKVETCLSMVRRAALKIWILLKVLHDLNALQSISQFHTGLLMLSCTNQWQNTATDIAHTCTHWSYATSYSASDSLASFSFGAGLWPSPMNDRTRMCFFSSTTDGQRIPHFLILQPYKSIMECWHTGDSSKKHSKQKITECSLLLSAKIGYNKAYLLRWADQLLTGFYFT